MPAPAARHIVAPPARQKKKAGPGPGSWRRAFSIREWANAGKRNGPKSVDLSDTVEMLIATGMRICELLGLRWSDLELTAPPERRHDEGWFPWLMVNGQIAPGLGHGINRKLVVLEHRAATERLALDSGTNEHLEPGL